MRQTQQIRFENVLENLISILYCSFTFENFGGGVENNPERSSISDECYFYAKYDKNASTRACFFFNFSWSVTDSKSVARCVAIIIIL